MDELARADPFRLNRYRSGNDSLCAVPCPQCGDVFDSIEQRDDGPNLLGGGEGRESSFELRGFYGDPQDVDRRNDERMLNRHSKMAKRALQFEFWGIVGHTRFPPYHRHCVTGVSQASADQAAYPAWTENRMSHWEILQPGAGALRTAERRSSD